MNQPSLNFAPRPPAQQHSRTSLAASDRVAPRAGTQRARVLDYLRQCGTHGATDHEIQAALGMGESTERPRRGELVDTGWVVDSGTTRLTPAGFEATVWRVA